MKEEILRYLEEMDEEIHAMEEQGERCGFTKDVMEQIRLIIIKGKWEY